LYVLEGRGNPVARDTRAREAARARSDRMSLRLKPETRTLIDRAVEATGTTLSDFAESNLVLAAQRALADRTSFTLNDEQWEEWERINSRPARDIPELRTLMESAEKIKTSW
jgi:uncharacterized protein (DUF1778 family)